MFPRDLAALVNLIFGLSMLCYFGDSSASIQLHLGDKDLAVFTHFCGQLGIQLNPGKSSTGNKIIFLGLLRSSPRHRTASSCQLPSHRRNAPSGLLSLPPI